MITGKNYIGNELSAEGSSVFEATNPATNEKLNKFHSATKKEVDAAVEKAAAAFPEFSATSADKRAEFLEAIGEEILNIGEELIQTYCAESGLPEGRANGERGRTVNQLKAFANYIRTGNWKDEYKDEANPDREP